MTRKSKSSPKVKPKFPTFKQVCAWCKDHNSDPRWKPLESFMAAEGWLAYLLDGTYSLDEMRAAVLEDRRPQEKK